MKLFSTSIPQQYLCIFILWAHFHPMEFRWVLLWCQWKQVCLRASGARWCPWSWTQEGAWECSGMPWRGAGVLIPSWLNPKCSTSFPGWEAVLKLPVLKGHGEVTDPVNSGMRVGGMNSFHPVHWEHFHGQGGEWRMGTDGNMLEGGGEKLHLVMG